MNYAVRFTFPYDKIAPWAARVAMASEKVCFYEHAENPDNIHVHGLLMGTSKDKSTLKNWFKEALRITPARTQWVFSMVQKDGKPLDEGFLAYMSKGKFDPKYNKGFTAEEIACAKAKGYDRPDRASVKGSKHQLYYEGFLEYIQSEQELLERTTMEGRFEYIRRRAYRYMMNTIALPLPHNLALYKACIIRYCFDNSIPLPTGQNLLKCIYGL